MPTDFEELKRQLLQTDEEFRQLATQHHDLDEQIHNLATRHYLSEPEQIEEVTLKKRKLQLKDQMETILRRTPCAREPTPRGAQLTHSRDTFQARASAGPRLSSGRSGPGPLLCTHPSDENRSSRISVHRRRAGAGRRPRGARRYGWAARLRRCSAASSPTSSAIRNGRSRMAPGWWSRRRTAGSMIAGPGRRPLGAARGLEADHDLPVADGRAHQPHAGRRARHAHRVPAGQVPAGVRRARRTTTS